MTTSDLDLANFRFSVDDDGVATVLIDRAGERMNTIAPVLFDELTTLVERIEGDPSIRAVVLGSAKPDNFAAGADIRWLETLHDKVTTIADFTEAGKRLQRLEDVWSHHGKPVVAAIHGPCLGGGLEVALTASMRICSDDDRTQFGQPEVKLGLIPAGGATQRLPRLIGIAAALDLILTGRSIRPRRARRIGLVDEVCPREVLLDVARARALEAIGRPGSSAKRAPGGVGRLKSWLAPSHLQQLALEENPVGRRLLFSKAEEKMLAETKGNYPAPPAALRAVRTGIEEGLDAGYAAEIAEFAELAASPEAAALISIFFAGQELERDPGIAGDASPRPVRKVGLLGGGLMGGGIAAVNATHAGVRTRIKEVDDAGVGRGLAYVDKVIAGRVKRRRMKPQEGARARQHVTGTTTWQGMETCDLVVEAVFEDLELKRSLLRDVEALGNEDMIFASNTSSLPIGDIAAAAARPEQVIGMHYFSPVERMPLLEVVVTDRTADWVTATCVAFGKSQGKTVIVVNDGTGFYTTRALVPYANEVSHLLLEGVRIEAIDGAMVAWGFPVGPVTLGDEVGIDVGAKIAGIMHAAFGERMRTPEAFAALVADGRMGRKNGRGYYTYEGGKKGDVDESVYGVLGISRHIEMAPEQIQERLALQFVNEAARCLEDGILRSARDGDIGAVYGLGFPPFRGGPFTWIDQIGAATVVARLDALAGDHGPRFEPATILREHAASGEPFRR